MQGFYFKLNSQTNHKYKTGIVQNRQTREILELLKKNPSLLLKIKKNLLNMNNFEVMLI